MLHCVHRDHKACLGTGAQDDHLDFHTAPELCRITGDESTPRQRHTKQDRLNFAARGPNVCKPKTIFRQALFLQITDPRRRVANACLLHLPSMLAERYCLAYKELLRHTFFQAWLLRSISSCLQGANACFQSSILAQSHFVWLTKNQCMFSEPFLLAFKELMHAFCQACLPRAIFLAFKELMQVFWQACLLRITSSFPHGT